MEDKVKLAGEKCESYRQMGYHCSESSIRGCADALDIYVPDEVYKAVAGFSGGGGGCRETCGLLTGGIALISFLYGRTDPKKPVTNNYYLIRVLHERFFRELGSINCQELRPANKYLKGLSECSPIFARAAEILAGVILEADKLIENMPETEK